MHAIHCLKSVQAAHQKRTLYRDLHTNLKTSKYLKKYLFFNEVFESAIKNRCSNSKSPPPPCLHGETFYINFYYGIFQFRENRITLRIFVSENTKLYNNDVKL